MNKIILSVAHAKNTRQLLLNKLFKYFEPNKGKYKLSVIQ